MRAHRVDRNYFMNGAKAPLKPKFEVDRLELDRLRDMAAVRKDTPYYGRGLRSASTSYKWLPPALHVAVF